MTQSKTSSKSKAKAARAEKSPKPKTYSWRGLTLALPNSLPGELIFDFAAFEDVVNGRRLAPFIDLLRSLIGEEQVRAVRAKIVEDKISLEDVFEEIEGLVNGILEQYGMGLGESSASQDS